MTSPMELSLFFAAFGFGFVARAVGLPPLVGYLGAGFVLYGFGIESGDGIEAVADAGVLLLLFGVGLKLRLATLVRPVVWGTATALGAVTIALFAGVFLALGALGAPLLEDLDVGGAVTVGFALSFSSTVFAVQALERTNESGSLAGRLAVGVLVLQDLFAVGFLVATGDGWPSLWALALIPGVVVARPVFGWLLDRSERGELLVLLGLMLAVAAGAGSFDAVGIKPDLGALVAGLMLASHPRAGELSDTLLGFKDLLLVGFFLSIGLGGTPPLAGWIVGLAVLVFIPLRVAGYLWLFTRFHLRSRTGLHAGLTLSTYSEFGLIVGAAALSSGILDQAWVSTIAISVAASFLGAAWANTSRYRIYERLSRRLEGLQREPIVSEDAVIDCGTARVLVFGMGRVGTGAYEEMVVQRRGFVVGVDRSEETVRAHRAAGRSVIRGDALDLDFWERIQFHPEVVLAVVAMSSHQANLECVRRIREFLPRTRIAAIATYSDEVEDLRRAGVDVARNLYEEAGQALVDDAVAVVWTDTVADETAEAPGQPPI